MVPWPPQSEQSVLYSINIYLEYLGNNVRQCYSGWVVIGLLASLLAVAVQRCRHGSPLPAYKYLLLTLKVQYSTVQYNTVHTSTYNYLLLKVHTEYGEAFFQSGPQLITQLVLFWTGVHTHDFQVTVLLLVILGVCNVGFIRPTWVTP